MIALRYFHALSALRTSRLIYWIQSGRGVTSTPVKTPRADVVVGDAAGLQDVVEQHGMV